ncbi:MAG: class I SAM-dependent methyltransferase [Clostridia bacterium]|nr:class I SAM-dependent methyltransferase [Clostridia bacterium]
MKQQKRTSQSTIRLGTHGEQYGTWMSRPVFYMVGGFALAALILAVLSFALFHITVLGIIFIVVLAVLIALIGWMEWIRRQYAFGGGGMMDKGHQTMLSLLDYDGNGTLLEVGCGSGALSIRAALTWSQSKIVGIDYWGAMWDYSKTLCEKNAASEGVASQCTFQKGDANKLDFADETFDALISNYVYHNVMGSDVHELILESLRVLKKGGVFAINDCMKPKMYGDMEAFAQKLRDMGYQEVRLVNMSELVFGSESRANMMMLGNSRMLIGRK